MAAGTVTAHGLTAEQRYGEAAACTEGAPVRRTVLSGVLLAGALHATPTAAQTTGSPGIDETVAYIRERCDGVSAPGSGWLRYGWSLGTNADFVVSENIDDGRVFVNVISIRHVTFSSNPTSSFVMVSCPQTIMIDECPLVRGRNYRDFEFFCREGKKVVNALKHLQLLLGGPAPTSDPFA